MQVFQTPCSHFRVAEGSCSICRKLDELNGNIAGIKGFLEHAVEQRRAYLEEVNHCHDPIQRLPVEIAAAVFSFCLPRPASLDVFDVDEETRDDLAIHPIQFLLGSVCRYWRQVVCSTPQMWNIIWVPISLCTPKVRSEILAEWLARSGQLPLYVSMFYIGFDYEDEDDVPRPGTVAWSSIRCMMNMLYLNVNRMRVLHLSLLGPQFSCFEQLQDANPATGAATTTSCILDKLFIEVLDFASPTFKLRSRVLSPTHVSLYRIEPEEVGIQWEHVTRVEAVDILIDAALEIPKMAPRLQFLKLEHYDADEVGNNPPILHSSLKYLDFAAPSVLPNFLDFIKCPALEELSTRLYDDSVTLQNFIKRSECSLKKLTLVSPFNQQLVSILRLTPSLTHLSLKNFRFPDDFLEIFKKTAYFEQGAFDRQGSFLPNLRSFTCTVDFTGFQWSTIASLIPHSRDDTKLVCRPLSEIVIILMACEVERATNYENITQILDLARDGGVSLKITDAVGTDLTRPCQFLADE